jgi:hypothetical protein
MIVRSRKLLKSSPPWLLLAFTTAAFGRGVSPYLPLNLEPEIESQIERVLILAGQPVMRRPIPAAAVLDALPKVCKIDQALCLRVGRYLKRYQHDAGLTQASIERAAVNGAGKASIDPNSYGMRESSHWRAIGQAFWQPGDHLLIGAGAVAYQGKTDYSGSLLSVGFDAAQLDIGFRPHWFSPMTDSSMLMSTEAPTMPSVTLSNYTPLTRFGLNYEIFAARMSNSSHILFADTLYSGHPRLAGIHLDMQPAEGWSLGVNRLMQYGGGPRGSSFKDLLRAYLNPSGFDNTSPTLSVDRQVGNQQASITSNLVFPGRVPFSVYFEYGGEDTSRGKSYLLGNSSLSAGIHFPRLWKRFDLTLEASEWQNGWYVHNVYLDGMTNYGRVTGNWGADQRIFGDQVGGRSTMARLGWDAPFGGLFELRYRTLQNQIYGLTQYDRYHDWSVRYSLPLPGVLVGGELDAGRDVFGGKFTRLAGFIRYNPDGWGHATASDDGDWGDLTPPDKVGEVFVDAGANMNRESISLQVASDRTRSPTRYGAHLGIGARRFVSDHSDLGARVEVDDIQGHSLIGVRALDYRYRFHGPLALSIFIGAARYDLATPAYGIYYGGGLQWRDVLPHFDVGVDLRYADSVARDHLLPSDPINIGGRNDSFYNILSTTLSVSYHF